MIGYGAWEAGGSDWGPNASEEAIVGAIRAGLDAGIDWIDTAEVYGRGVSESLVGRAVEGRRDQVVLATKVAPEPEGTGFRPEQVRAAAEGSLRRLQTDRIDLYQLHWADEGVPVEETWGAMADLQDAGLVRWLGVSNLEPEAIERCEPIRHVDSLQPEFSMLDRRHADTIRWCAARGTGVVSYGPLAYGLLTGAIDPQRLGSLGDWRDEETEGVFAPEAAGRIAPALEGITRASSRLGVTPAQLALAWNVQQPGVTAAIAGSRNPDHVRENAAAGDLVPDDDTLEELDALLLRADQA